MLSRELQNATEMFVAAVAGCPEMDSFVRTKDVFQNDGELIELRKHIAELSKVVQSKQATGTPTQEEIDRMRGFQKSVNSHPLTVEYLQARKAIITRLQECNDAVSAEIGFDFASAAAPQSCCG
jgi:cell fate (sporulation/competence/biofilm development) regulator YlbF (YheA/YmcA/DUF963 family)